MSEIPKEFSTTSEKRKKRRRRKKNKEADGSKRPRDRDGKGKSSENRREEIQEIKGGQLESNPVSKAEKRKRKVEEEDDENSDSDEDFFRSKIFILSMAAINVIFISGAIALFALTGSCSESTNPFTNKPYATQNPYGPPQTNQPTKRPYQPGPAPTPAPYGPPKTNQPTKRPNQPGPAPTPAPYIPQKTNPPTKRPLNPTPSPTAKPPSENSESENSEGPVLIEEDHFTVDANFKCGIPPVEPDLKKGKIVGGAEAVPNSWPYAAAFGTYDISGGKLEVSQMCGSTIITPRHALTAAHCFMMDPDIDQTYYIFMGLHDETTYKGVRPNKIVGVRYHPKTNVFTDDPWLVYDFAILTLRKKVIANFAWNYACLPQPKKIPPEGTICWSVGWGVTQNTGGDNVLKQVAIDLVSEKRCKEEYRSTITSKSTICGGTTPGQDTCQGDSGGPLFCKEDGKWYLQGIVSYGPSVCGSGPMAAYAAVAYNLEWLCCYMPNLPSCEDIECDESGEN